MSKPDLSSIGVPTNILLFSSFEVDSVIEVDGELMNPPDEPLDGEVSFWTVYGRRSMGDVQVREALVDVTDEASARAVKSTLEMLHEGACRKESFRR